MPKKQELFKAWREIWQRSWLRFGCGTDHAVFPDNFFPQYQR